MTRTNSRTSKKNKCQNTAITLKLQLRANNDKGGTSSFWENGQSERQSWRRKTVRCARKHNSQLQRREEKRHKEIRPRPAGRERRRAGSDPCWRMPGSNLCVVKVVESSRFTLQLFKAATHGAPAIMRCVCMCVCMCVCVCAQQVCNRRNSSINNQWQNKETFVFRLWGVTEYFSFLEMIHEVVKHINCCNSYLPTERQDRFFFGEVLRNVCHTWVPADPFALKQSGFGRLCTLWPHGTYVSANQVHVEMLRSKFSISCRDCAYGLVRFRDFSDEVRIRSCSDLKYLLLLPRRQLQNIPKVNKITWFC